MTVRDLAPRSFRPPKKRPPKGLLILYTGDGKGKSTAAFGAAFRCLGRGMRVGIVQFIKGKWVSGEIKALERFGSRADYFAVGEGFTWETKSLRRDIAIAEKGWRKCLEMIRKKQHDLLIFDEVLYVLLYRFLNTKSIIRGLAKKGERVHIILTGRGAPPALVELADLVTEMKEVKHPFHKGILAQPGIDF